MGDTRLLSSLPWRKTFSDYIFLSYEGKEKRISRGRKKNQKKKETKNNCPGVSFAPFRPSFRVHMLQARPTLGVCFLSQPYFVPLFWLCLVHVRSAVDSPVMLLL